MSFELSQSEPLPSSSPIDYVDLPAFEDVESVAEHMSDFLRWRSLGFVVKSSAGLTNPEIAELMNDSLVSGRFKTYDRLDSAKGQGAQAVGVGRLHDDLYALSWPQEVAINRLEEGLSKVLFMEAGPSYRPGNKSDALLAAAELETGQTTGLFISGQVATAELIPGDTVVFSPQVNDKANLHRFDTTDGPRETDVTLLFKL